VAAVADATLAIGRVVEAGAALTSVKVKLFTKRAGRAASGT
jgi:hypothetical protein